MINTLQDLLTFDSIYLFANWGVVPFWLLLIFIPSHPITKFFCYSIIPFLLLGVGYAFVSYQIFLEGNILEGFKLYLSLDSLDEIYANESTCPDRSSPIHCHRGGSASVHDRRSAC